MPIYEFKCKSCNYGFDKLVMRHDTEVVCPICQGGVRKLMLTFAVGPADKGGHGVPETGPGCMSCSGCANC